MLDSYKIALYVSYVKLELSNMQEKTLSINMPTSRVKFFIFCLVQSMGILGFSKLERSKLESDILESSKVCSTGVEQAPSTVNGLRGY